jgi:sterol desaturase/sphingolipid hydroxylase (fatty acid hydroxylase superfamily)
VTPAGPPPSRRRGAAGWLSGIASVALGAMGLGAVLCLWFPAVLTTPELREIYDMTVIRAVIKLGLLAAFLLGAASLVLKRRKALGVTGIALSVAATLLGGSQVEVSTPVARSSHVGLDWFLLNLLVLAMVFVPLEQILARWPEQGLLRPGWKTDLAHFAMSHLLVQVTVLLTMAPAAIFFRWAVSPALQSRVAALPAAVQFVAILVVADLTQYAIHRAFHRVPALWRFHAIHHSSTALDWLASSRLHLVDIVVTRALSFVPIYVLGFAPGPTYAYLVFVSFETIFIHANVGVPFGPLRWVVATPQFHHWHHSAQAEAVDKNFAVHLPLIDLAFGTFHLPRGRWPERYGLADARVPEGYLAQLTFPFRRGAASPATPPG